MHTVKNKWSRPTFLEINDWLKEKAEAHDRMKVTSAELNADEIPHAATKRKTASKVFASTSKADAPTVGHSVLPTKPASRIDCKEPHALLRCLVFRWRTPMQKVKFVADNKFCFSCLNGQNSFRQCPKPRSAPPKVVQALTTFCYTELRDFSNLGHYADRTL